MRIASYAFLALVLLLLVNLAISAAYPPYREYVRNFRTSVVPGYTQTSPAVVNPSQTSTESGLVSDVQLTESLNRVNAWLDALVAASNTGVIVSTGNVATGATSTWVVKTPEATGSVVIVKEVPKSDDIAVSGLLLSRLMPDVTLKKTDNKGIFDIHIFSSIPYTTYKDEKWKMKVYAFGETYSVMLSNLKLVSSVYGVKETDTFFDSTFFLNATSKKDTNVRFVTELEGKAVGIEIPKSSYPKLKKLLLKK